MSITTWAATTGDWDDSKFSRPWIGPDLSPDKGDLTLSSSIPTGSSSYFIIPGNATLTILKTYTWDNYGGTWAASSDAWNVEPFVPSAIETGQNQPDAGSLTLTGLAPSRTIQKLWYVPSGSLAVTGFVPTFSRGHIFIPDAASLSGFGTTSWADTSGDWASSSDTWGTGTLFPTAGVTYTFTIDAAGNLVFTPYDPQWPLIGDPYYIPEIIIS